MDWDKTCPECGGECELSTVWASPKMGISRRKIRCVKCDYKIYRETELVREIIRVHEKLLAQTRKTKGQTRTDEMKWDNTCPECGGMCDLKRIEPPPVWEIKCLECNYYCHSLGREQALNHHKKTLETVQNSGIKIPLLEQAQSKASGLTEADEERFKSLQKCPLCAQKSCVITVDEINPNSFYVRCSNCSYQIPMCTSEKAAIEAHERNFPKFLAEQAQDPDLNSKIPFELLDLDFAAAMCDNFKDGVKNGRVANGWKNMGWTKQLEGLYTAKIMRHIKSFCATGDVQHMAAIACDANIIWHHTRKEKNV